jgi:hypothetical protein
MLATWFVLLLICGAIGLAITINVISGFIEGMRQK